jgi:hypothetical protein
VFYNTSLFIVLDIAQPLGFLEVVAGVLSCRENYIFKCVPINNNLLHCYTGIKGAQFCSSIHHSYLSIHLYLNISFINKNKNNKKGNFY